MLTWPKASRTPSLAIMRLARASNSRASVNDIGMGFSLARPFIGFCSAAASRVAPGASSPMELIGFAGITPRHGGMEAFMSHKKAGTGSYVEIFWEFLRDNPELATMIAFELGSLAGVVVRNSGGKKYLKNGVKKVPQALSDA